MSKFHSLEISEIKKETPNAVVITLRVPGDKMKDFAFKAGQYVTLRHEINGKEIRRAYSICSAPSASKLKIAIKRVENGTFSVFATSTFKAGDVIDVMPPEGLFVFEPEKEATKNYAAFAAGSGITPILSIIKTVLEDEPNSRFLLVYGNQTLKDTMFYEELVALKRENNERLQIQFLFSRERQENARFGRIERGVVNFFLKKEFEFTNFDAFYICGPEPMIDEVSSTLKENHINEKMIHFELFTTAEDGLLVEAHDGNTKVTIVLDDETETYTMPQDTSVLQAALDKGLDAPYSCQGGICSTCIARITEGKAEMRKNQILTDSEVAEGLILTCQAHPTTPTITVDYDDV